MEKPNFAMNGELKLPIGYRFRPTDAELVVHYLKRKVFAVPLPALVIPEFDVFQTDPRGLPGDLKEKRYFFSKRSGNVNHNKCKRVAGYGYWKPIGKEKQIVASETNQLVGMRKTLVFCNGKGLQGTKTQWVMHEFRLVGCETSTNSTTQTSKTDREWEHWVVYRVFQRKRKPKRHGIISEPSNSNFNTQTTDVIRPSFIVLTVEDGSDIGPPQPCSSCSSEITEVSYTGLDQEASSACISFSSYSYMREQ